MLLVPTCVKVLRNWQFWCTIRMITQKAVSSNLPEKK